MLDCYEQATEQALIQRVVVDREGMAAEFLAQLQQEGRQIVTLLRSDQYEGEGSFQQVGPWQPWRCNRRGEVICEVASARFTLSRPDPAAPEITVEVALIRDWRKFLPVEESGEASDDRNWLADLSDEQTRFWEEGWQALPAPAPQTTPKLIPVITTGQGMEVRALAQTYFRRWNCQENAIRDWLIPLNLDTNHGYAKELVVNSELCKRQEVVQGRIHRLEQLAQASRARLTDLQEKAQHLREQISTYEEQSLELLLQVTALEATDQTEERAYFPLKARQLAADWQVRKRRAKLEKNATQSQEILNKCERYCQKLRHELRQHEDLQAQARQMYELDHSKDQIMTLFKVALANLGMWVRDHYFGESYQHCGWQRLLPFFKLGGRITTTGDEVRLEVCAFNNRELVRDVEEVCHNVNTRGATLPDGRRVVMAVGERLHAHQFNAPLVRAG